MTEAANRQDKCEFCPAEWTVQAWRTGMQVREWLCTSHFARRSQEYDYQIECDYRGDDGLTIKHGMKVVQRVMAHQKLLDSRLLDQMETCIAQYRHWNGDQVGDTYPSAYRAEQQDAYVLRMHGVAQQLVSALSKHLGEKDR